MENEHNPLVSIGIPTYNRPQRLRKTLAGITCQTYSNLEIIVSNNCSSNDKLWSCFATSTVDKLGSSTS